MKEKQEENKIYMIRRRKDGLFSSGSSWPCWGRHGKMWDSLKTLNLHLTNIYKDNYYGRTAVLKRGQDGRFSTFDFGAFADMKHNPYLNCDIVEVELSYNVKVDIFNHLALRYVKDETPATETKSET